MKAATVRFGRRLVRLFAAASGDDHPLHTSRELSRLTPYGEPIVYGILQGLAALGAVRQEPGWILWGVGFDFLGSAVPGVDYGLEVERLAEDRVRVRIQDGRLPVMTANVAFGRPGEAARGGAGAAAPEGAGWRTKGAYRPDREALSAVMAATGLDQPWITPGHVAALMWASHLVGVEQRHERVFLVGVKALFGEPPEGEGFDGEAWVERTGGRGEIVLAGRFGVAGSAFGSLRVGAARLASPPAPDGDRLRALLGGPAPGAAGGMALVIGGSRGLGAALARGLALRGYRVLATYSRGAGPAAEEAGIELLQGDARSHRWYGEVARRILGDCEGLEVLVVNAWPAIRPLSISPGSARRARRHLADGLAIVTEALASLLPALRPGGWNVLVSSAYVGSPRPYFSHYIAGKAAAEALVRSAALEHPAVRHLIVRPPKLKTHQTSSALGGSALDVEPMAAAVIERLRSAQPPGEVGVLEEIPAAPVHEKP